MRFSGRSDWPCLLSRAGYLPETAIADHRYGAVWNRSGLGRGRKTGAWAIMLLTLAMCYEVFARYLLQSPTEWAFDMSYILYGVAVSCWLGPMPCRATGMFVVTSCSCLASSLAGRPRPGAVFPVFFPGILRALLCRLWLRGIFLDDRRAFLELAERTAALSLQKPCSLLSGG